ncbi:MAG: DNA ligase-associated DEXH box helicase, partial [Comamonadaceae bacterium]
LTEAGLEAQGFKTEYGDEDVADMAPSPSGGGQGRGPTAPEEDPPPGLPPEGEGATQ